MKSITKAMLWLLLLGGAVLSSYAGTGKEGYEKEAAQYKMPAPYVKLATDLYNEMGLMAHGLEKDIFLKAYKGYLLLVNRGLVRNQQVLSIADFSQSNQNKRLYIIDLRNRKLLLQTFVSHGRNSGEEMATSFSNANNSNKSVLGFLLTADTYTGEHGLALRFRGLERGINDMVTQRAIVVHGSKFVNEKELARRGEMVNSLGCPAVPMSQSKTIIHAIKGGSVYFIYHPDESYARKSQILNGSLEWTWLQPAMVAAAPDSVTLPANTLLQ
jgi:hypothetical protein